MGDAAARMGDKVVTTNQKMTTSYRTLMVTSAGMIANSVQMTDCFMRVASSGQNAEMAQREYQKAVAASTFAIQQYGEYSEEAIRANERVKRAQDNVTRAQQEGTRGAIMLGMNFLQLASQIVLLNAKYGEKIGLQLASVAMDAKSNAAAIAHAAAEGIAIGASWARVAAEKAKAIAMGIAHALSGPWGWAILAGAAAVVGSVYALTASIPSKEVGGAIYETRPYLLHYEEYVETPAERRNITALLRNLDYMRIAGAKSVYIAPGAIVIQESRNPRRSAEEVVDALRRRGVI